MINYMHDQSILRGRMVPRGTHSRTGRNPVTYTRTRPYVTTRPTVHTLDQRAYSRSQITNGYDSEYMRVPRRVREVQTARRESEPAHTWSRSDAYVVLGRILSQHPA